MPQGVVIIQILVAQSQRVDALPHQGRDRMPDAREIAMILEARGELREDPRGALDLAQQHRAAVGRQRAPVKPPHDGPARDLLKVQCVRDTLCRHNGCLPVGM